MASLRCQLASASRSGDDEGALGMQHISTGTVIAQNSARRSQSSGTSGHMREGTVSYRQRCSFREESRTTCDCQQDDRLANPGPGSRHLRDNPARRDVGNVLRITTRAVTSHRITIRKHKLAAMHAVVRYYPIESNMT
jgi:hypothetical protein